jgi:hypothetical protein
MAKLTKKENHGPRKVPQYSEEVSAVALAARIVNAPVAKHILALETQLR